MFCKQCGKPIDDDQVLCEDCQKATASENTQNTNTNTQTYTATPNNNPVAKSKIAAGLFGIFLGAFGVHNFYLGYTGKAVAQLLITLLTCGFGAFISSIWGFIEGILILAGSITTDANGMPLRD